MSAAEPTANDRQFGGLLDYRLRVGQILLLIHFKAM